MDENIKLLDFISQNSQMGIVSINELLTIVEDDDFKSQLKSQLVEYKKINCIVQEKLKARGYDENNLSSFAKIRTYIMIDMQTIKDKSNSHIAEMMMIGSNMGIIKAIRDIHVCTKADKDIIKLMEQLRKTEENNIEHLKNFL